MTTLRKKRDCEQSGQGQTLKVSKLKRSKFAIERVTDIARFLFWMRSLTRTVYGHIANVARKVSSFIGVISGSNFCFPVTSSPPFYYS